MDNNKQKSMIDIACDLMVKKKKPIDFYKLWKEVSEIKGFNEEEDKANQSLFYTIITLDGRFITTGENFWDLRGRHKYESVHIDMNDVYADEEEEIVEEEDEEIVEDEY
jgi:DNA-directed RNA polymerase, delta subunit